MIISQKHNNAYKDRMGHKHKTQVTEQKSLNYNFEKPFLERERDNISFKGGFSLSAAKKAFAPYIRKNHNLRENLEILQRNIGKAPVELNAESSQWSEIGSFLKRNADGTNIEITEKNWLALLWDGIKYPITDLPFHLGKWAKNLAGKRTQSSNSGLIHDTTGASGYVKRKFNTLDNTDIVNSMSGYMESAQKYKYDTPDVQSAGLFTRAMKTFDPKSGNYNGVHERALTRIVSGLIPAYFLANDAYNLSRLCDDDEKAAQKEKKMRFNQEIKRVMSNAYLQLITLGALSKYINKNIGTFVGVTAITVFITEAFSRLSNGKKIHFISKEEAIKLNQKEKANQKNNVEEAKEEPQKIVVTDASKSKPGFKGSGVFNAFGLAADMPATVANDNVMPNSKEMKPLLSLPTIAKWFVGTIALGFAIKKAKNIKIKENVLVKDIMNVISQKYDNVYNKITQREFKIPKAQFKKIITKLKTYDEVIANKIEEIALQRQKVNTIKKESLNIAQTLKESGLEEFAEFFEHLNNLKLNSKIKDIPAYNLAKKFFAARDNKIIASNLNELFKLMKDANLGSQVNELKNIILKEDGTVNLKQYKQAFNYVKGNAREYLFTFENRFKVDTETETLKTFNAIMDELKKNSQQKAEEFLKKVADSTEAEFISLGKKNIKGVREAADFITEPFKFMWGTITLPYKHVANKIYNLVKNEKTLPKWENEVGAVSNILTKVQQKPIFSGNRTPMVDRTDTEFAKFMNKQINKAFNTSTMSSISNSDLSALAKNTSTAATIWFLMADNHNMVMQKTNGDGKKDATLKAKERLVQETSRTFYNVMFINLFNNTFKSLYNSSLFGAQTVNTASTLIGEYVNRKAIGVPVGEHTRKEILDKDYEHLTDKGIKGSFFRFMSRLTGKKALSQREQTKK